MESIVWNYSWAAQRLLDQFYIVNVPDPRAIVQRVNALQPDVVHVHCELWARLMPHFNAKVKILATHDGDFFTTDPEARTKREQIYQSFIRGDFYVHCLSEDIRDYFLTRGVNQDRLLVIRNGARTDLFSCANRARYPDRSVCVGRVTPRKRQFLLADVPFVDFVGPPGDDVFDYRRENYLGEWPKDKLYERLTDYSSLVLLSRSEAAPLVTCEALAAGLGLIISQNAAANLDLTKPYIRVVPEDRIADTEFLTTVIREVQQTAVRMRTEIRRYALSRFNWQDIVTEYVHTLNRLCAISDDC